MSALLKIASMRDALSSYAGGLTGAGLGGAGGAALGLAGGSALGTGAAYLGTRKREGESKEDFKKRRRKMMALGGAGGATLGGAGGGAAGLLGGGATGFGAQKGLQRLFPKGVKNYYDPSGPPSSPLLGSLEFAKTQAENFKGSPKVRSASNELQKMLAEDHGT